MWREIVRGEVGERRYENGDRDAQKGSDLGD
jgi:hypothetical protein